MTALLRSQFYSLRREMKPLGIIFILFTLMTFVYAFMYSGDFFFTDEYMYGEKLTASEIFASFSQEFCIFAELYIVIAAGLFMSTDLNDKTVNYEIMQGHSRRSVFMSRAIVTMLVSSVGGMLMFLSITLVNVISTGWGEAIPLSTALERWGLIFLLFCRIGAELIFVTAIVKRTAFVYITAAVTVVGEILAAAAFEEGSPYIMSITAGSEILDMSTFQVNHFDGDGGWWEFFHDYAPNPALTFGIAVSYILVTVGLIYLSMLLFEQSDVE